MLYNQDRQLCFKRLLGLNNYRFLTLEDLNCYEFKGKWTRFRGRGSKLKSKKEKKIKKKEEREEYNMDEKMEINLLASWAT